MNLNDKEKESTYKNGYNQAVEDHIKMINFLLLGKSYTPYNSIAEVLINLKEEILTRSFGVK